MFYNSDNTNDILSSNPGVSIFFSEKSHIIDMHSLSQLLTSSIVT